MYSVREAVEAGGLMSYGANVPDLFRGAANHVDKILRGTKPADIPVEQPSKFDLIINLTTAKALDLLIPESFLLRADDPWCAVISLKGVTCTGTANIARWKNAFRM
jgi:putative tryptophan/tyrosine transport system substrate-binding protein